MERFVSELLISNKIYRTIKEETSGADFSLKEWAVPKGMVYPHVPLPDILLCVLTSMQRHIKLYSPIKSTMSMRVFLKDPQRNCPP